MERTRDETPEERAARVAALKSKVEAGAYRVSPDAIVENERLLVDVDAAGDGLFTHAVVVYPPGDLIV